LSAARDDRDAAMAGDSAAALGDAFDRGFAAPPRATATGEVELLRVQVGGRPFVLAVADISSIHAGLRITPLPAAAGSAALGVVSIRGVIVPVYDLRAVLGIAADTAPRWIAVAGSNGYAFDALDGFVRVPARPVAGGAVVFDGRPHPLVELTREDR
jgi:hypothetical protein